MAAIGEKRLIDDVASSSLNLVSKKGKTVLDYRAVGDALTESSEVCPDPKNVKKMLDHCDVDDAFIEAGYVGPDNETRRLDILGDKLHVKEYQLFYISINQPERAKLIRSLDDILDRVSASERLLFRNKGWRFVPRLGKDYYYQYLCLVFPEDSMFSRYFYTTNTYAGDLKYDAFYGVISEQIKLSMSLEESGEIAEIIRAESFPEIDSDVLWGTVIECRHRMKCEKEVDEKITLFLKLHDGVINRKRDFWEVLEEIYKNEIASYPCLKTVIEEDFELKAFGCSRIRTRLMEICSYVNAKLANSHENLEVLLRQYFGESLNSFEATYGDYVKEKIRIARKLGIAFP